LQSNEKESKTGRGGWLRPRRDLKGESSANKDPYALRKELEKKVGRTKSEQEDNPDGRRRG